MDVVGIVLVALMGVVFLMSGATKLMAMEMHVEHFTTFGYPQWFRNVTGLVELVGGALLGVGVFVEDVAVAGAAVIAVTMVGALYTDLFRNPQRMAAIAPLVLGVLVVVGAALRVSG